MKETFLGFGSIFWQFINGLLSTLIIGICMGVISTIWLNKRDQLNAEEGALLNQRVDAYFGLLNFMSSLENKKILMDPDCSIRDELDKEGIVIRRDRPAVEYWPMLEDLDQLEACYKRLNEFYEHYLALMDPKAAKELIFTYGMFTRIYEYYVYLSTVEVENIGRLTQDEVRDILKRFYPKLGMALDVDLTIMQTRLERKLVTGVYHLRFTRNNMLTQEQCAAYFTKRYAKTDLLLLEKGLFRGLVKDAATVMQIPAERAFILFAPNIHVKSCAWEGEKK